MDTSTVVGAVDTLGRRIARRRLRTIEERLAIVAESRVAGTSVAEVARRHGVNANQVFAWRRQQEQGVLVQGARPGGVKLLPVQVQEERSEPADPVRSVARAGPGSPGRIEITLGKKMRVAIVGDVALARIEQVLGLLRRLP